MSVLGGQLSQSLRLKLVKGLLSKEVGWFDINGANKTAVEVSDLINKVRDGMGRRLGEIFQYGFQVITAYLVGFYFSWKLTLVVSCAVPIKAFICKYFWCIFLVLI